MKTTFCATHGLDIEEGDCCKECLFSWMEAEAQDMTEKIQQRIAAGKLLPGIKPEPYCGYCQHRHSPTQDHFLG